MQLKDLKFLLQKLKVIPNYIDTDSFKPLDLEKERGRIIFVGRLEREKNLFSLIEAIRDLSVKLVIFGSGSLKEELEEFAKEKGANVEFKGNIANEKLPEELNKSEIFVLPSFYEGCPKVLLEAISIKKAILEALNDKELQRKISQNARKTILNEFSFEKILGRELRIYEDLCEKI